MKNLLLLIFLFAFTLIAYGEHLQKNAYKIEGKLIAATDGAYVFLSHGRQVDSVQIQNSKFTFTDTLAYPDMFFLRYAKDHFNMLRIFIQPGEIHITGDANSLVSAKIDGNGAKDWNDFLVKMKPIYVKAAEVNRKAMGEGKTLTSEEKEEITIMMADMNMIAKETVASHPNSPLSGWILNEFLSGNKDFDSAMQLYNGLGENAKQSHYAKKFKANMDGLTKVKIGNPASAFILIDKDGKDVSLSDYRGKYVILDFWGSWCTPCRKSHPHLVELYNKYKDKNFDILGLAGNDKNRDKWLNAIKEDGLVWKQVNLEDNNAKQNIGELYSIQAYPTKVLVSPDGIILAYCVGDSEAIDAKLKEIFEK